MVRSESSLQEDTIDNDSPNDLMRRNSTVRSRSHSQPRSWSRPQSQSSSVAISTIEQVLTLDELRVGDHVLWNERRSPMLVVELTVRRMSSLVPSAEEQDQPIYERCVTLRGQKHGECTLYRRSDGILAAPLSRYGWINGLCRIVPQTRRQYHPPENIPSNGDCNV